MQALLSSDGLKVIEVNPRFGGVSTASISVGLDSFSWAIWEAFFPTRALPSFERSEKEVRNVRVGKDIVIEWP